MEPPTHEITQLLHAWSQGDQSALDHLMPLVYDDRHRMAQRFMAQERPDHTLQATALVHESYLRDERLRGRLVLSRHAGV